MAIDEFPLGQPLTALSTIEYQGFKGNELGLEKVRLFFPDQTVTLLPIADTDEIDILDEMTTDLVEPTTPFWGEIFLGKKLMTVWVCENDQGYRDQVIFAFERLHPSLAFVAEGSVLKTFSFQQIYREPIFPSVELMGKPPIPELDKLHKSYRS